MCTQIRGFDAAGAPVVTKLFPLRFSALATIATFGLLTACADAPRLPLAGQDPADPGARAPRADYRPAVGSYKSQRPVEPAPWVEQNKQVTPPAKAGQ
jgi:hypothetical protein